MNKSGNLGDIPTAVGLFFMIFLILFFMTTIQDNFGQRIRMNNATNYTELNDFYDTYSVRYYKAVDYGIFFLALGFIVFSFIAARLIPSNTIYMIILWLFLPFFILFLMVMSNLYGKMIENVTIAAFVDKLIFIPLIMPNLLWYGLIYLGVVIVALYTKKTE